jgi:hypothetical protein
MDPGRIDDRRVRSSRWNGRAGAHLPDPLAKASEACPRSPATQHGTSGRRLEQTGCERQFMRLARRESKGDGPPTPVGDHVSPCAIAAARSAKRFASISLSAMPPLFFSARRLVVSPDVGAVDEGHAERHALLLHQRQQALPDTSLGPADEDLRRQPPRLEIVRHAAPLRAVLMPPEDRRNGPAQLLQRCFAVWPGLLDQRLPHCPDRIREKPAVFTLRHISSIRTIIRF